MKIIVDIWMDYTCPFCYIGFEEFNNAIDKLGNRDELEINYKAFQLDRGAPLSEGHMAMEALVRKLGSVEKVKEMQSIILDRAEKLGIKFNYDIMQAQNTIKAHTIYKLAKEQGLGNEYQKAMFKAVFQEGSFMYSDDNIKKVGQEIGLDLSNFEELLHEDSKYLKAVKEDLVQAIHFKITGVPFYVFNNKYSIQGAQDQGMYERVMLHVKKEIEEEK